MNFEEWYATQDKNVFRSGEEHMRLAYSAGAERMREKAAQLANQMMCAAGDTLSRSHDDDASAQYDTASEIEEAIRALPIGESIGAPQEKP